MGQVLKDVRDICATRGLVSRNGKVLTVSNTQMILKNPFYYGAFVFNGEIYQGKHKPAVTKKLFDQCQEVMKQKAHPTKRGEYQHVFRSVLSCGECGCGITSEVQKGHVYYRCTKKKGACSQPYLREESLASQVSDYLKQVSLSSAWADAMLKELEKEQAQTTHADALFVQNLKLTIGTCEEKLDKLLDAHLENTISREEYTTKKRILLDQKIDCEQQLVDFKRKGNRWLELCRTFIKDANQAEIAASGENLSSKKDFLRKAGSNPLVRARALGVTPRNPWKILHETPLCARSAPPVGANRTCMLRVLNEVRTFFQNNPTAD